METAIIKVMVEDDYLIPSRKHETDAGLDLKSNEEFILRAGERRTVHTGVWMQLQEGYEAQIRPRSGLAAKEGLTIVNSPGTVDADYRGELMVILLNTSFENVHIKQFDRIAQMVVKEVVPVFLIKVDELDKTERGENGLGSTSKE